MWRFRWCIEVYARRWQSASLRPVATRQWLNSTPGECVQQCAQDMAKPYTAKQIRNNMLVPVLLSGCCLQGRSSHKITL